MQNITRKIKKIRLFLKVFLFGKVICDADLKEICEFLARTNRHFIYELFLSRLDNKLKFLPARKNKSFFTSGMGKGNLNVYRKIIYNNETLFEKIFFKDHKDFYNVNWFYNNQYHIISGLGLKVPNIKKKIEGENLCIIYFEFLKLGNLKNYIGAFHVSNLLYRNRQLFVSSHNQLVEDYIFRRGEERFINHLMEAGINLDRYKIFKEKILYGMPTYFQHADLTTNCYESDLVLDWDRSGYYPFGVDYGFIIADMLNLKIINLSKIREFVSDLVRKYHLPVNSEKSIVYFSLVFWLRRSKFKNKINSILIEWLMDKEKFFVYE